MDETSDTEAANDSRRGNPKLEELLILGVMAKPDSPFGGGLSRRFARTGPKVWRYEYFHRLDNSADATTPGYLALPMPWSQEPSTYQISRGCNARIDVLYAAARTW